MRYFAVSDVHGFLKPLLKALSEAGYDKSDPGHFLVVCGDVFDRGPDPYGTMTFLKSVPKDRIALVRGNHEDLMLELAYRGIPEWYDDDNGTMDTLASLSNPRGKTWGGRLFDARAKALEAGRPLDLAADEERLARRLLGSPRAMEALEWLRSPEWRDFLETGTRVCVHASIPHRPDWRKPGPDWADARWPCPADEYKSGAYAPVLSGGKGIVCGHWHTCGIYHRLRPREWDPSWKECPIYDCGGLACIDACTAATGRVNVLVWDE